MKTRNWIRRALVAGIVGAAALATASPALATRATGDDLIATQPARVTGTCFWGKPTGRLDGANILGIDTHVSYWYDRYELPPGATVKLRGQFPHARFMSLETYKTVDGRGGISNTALLDADINPDRRSRNPFRPGVKRTVPRRSFTVTLSAQPDPGAGGRARNTLYTGQAAQAGAPQTVELMLRVYRPDKNRDMAGGVALPTPIVSLADGSQLRGQQACKTLNAQSGFDKLPAEGLGVPQATYKLLLGLSPLATHPAVDPIRFDKFFNLQRLAEPFYRGTALQPRIATLPTVQQSGFYATSANAYVTGYADRSFGPRRDGHNILVLRGRMPTHPRTWQRTLLDTASRKQVRYWSLCNYGAIANPPLLPANSSCLFDEQVPTDRKREYEIVVSLPKDRPRNAIDRCGVAWLDWGRAGDGMSKPRLINLVMRNQLSDPSFARGIDKVVTPGTEAQVMGHYLPSGSYTTKAQFERRGCKPR